MAKKRKLRKLAWGEEVIEEVIEAPVVEAPVAPEVIEEAPKKTKKRGFFKKATKTEE
jgi:hypothetical protein